MTTPTSPPLTSSNTSSNNHPTFQPFLHCSQFPFDFQSTISPCKCALCHGIPYLPVSDNLGNLYCHHCKTKYISLNLTPSITFNPKVITQLSNVILHNSIHCINKSKGCTWYNEVSRYETHINTECTKQIVNCPNKECNYLSQRDQMQLHLIECEHRLINCDNCDTSLKFCNLNEHNKSCPKAKITCIQQCGVVITRDMLLKHIEDECVKSVVECPFRFLGCNEKGYRHEMEKHMKDKWIQHMLGFLNEVQKFKAKIGDVIDKGIEDGVKEMKMKMENDATKKIEEYMNIIKKDIERFSYNSNNGNNGSSSNSNRKEVGEMKKKFNDEMRFTLKKRERNDNNDNNCSTSYEERCLFQKEIDMERKRLYN